MIVFWKVTCGNSHVWPIRIHITFSVRLHILSTWCCEKNFVHQLRVLVYLHEKTLKLWIKLVFLACSRMNSLFCNSSLKFQKAVREHNGQRVSLMNVCYYYSLSGVLTEFEVGLDSARECKTRWVSVLDQMTNISPSILATTTFCLQTSALASCVLPLSHTGRNLIGEMDIIIIII